MDYGKIMSRAWEITWGWKVLWVLGFLASLGQSSPSSTNTYTTSGQEFDFERFTQGAQFEQFLGALSGIVIAAICLFAILAVVLWVISVIARGGLIAGVFQVEDQGFTTFGQAWAAGRKKFWTLFGLGILAAIPGLILVFILAILFGLGIAAGVGLMQVEEAAGISTIILSSLVFLCLLCCGLILLTALLQQIRIYGERAAILEDMGWIDAFKRGWETIRNNLGPTIIFWLIFFAIGLVIFGIIFVIVMIISLPVIFSMSLVDPGPWLVIPGICVGLIALVIGALIRSVITAFTSATWTLAYREFTASKEANA